MARKLTYNTTRFDGGMTDNVRNIVDPSKCAFSSHFDIYSNPEELRVMPGYVADESYDGSGTGMRQFKVRAFNIDRKSFLQCAGEKAAGGGTKVFHKENITSAEWAVGSQSIATNSEATATLVGRPSALIYNVDTVRTFALTYNTGSSGFVKLVKIDASSTTDESYGTLGGGAGQAPATVKIDGIANDSDFVWFNVGDGLVKDNGTTASIAKSTDITWSGTIFVSPPLSLVQSVRGLWYLVRKRNNKCDLRLWDKNSTLDDINIELTSLNGGHVGEVGGSVVVVANERLGTDVELSASEPITNGMVGFSIKTFDGYSFDTPYRQVVPTPEGSILVPLGQSYKGSMLFYARFATNTAGTAFREGIWALGRRSPDRPVALSLLMDMGTLGRYNSYFTFGNNHYFAHHTDWKISKLDNFATGTYDVPATYETLFYGADTPFLKQLEGMTVRSQTLPSGATIEVQYRTEPDGAWTSMGTSTSGKKHHFTRVDGSPIGKFQEIQFKIIATGKIVINGISVGITELDDMPYKL